MSKYTTGEIAKLCGVSVRTVQYYDSRNILVPSELSEGGRRLYSEQDLKRMKIICFLRDAGISINNIGELLSEDDPGSVISVLLEQQEQALCEEVSERQEKLAILDGIKKELRGIDNFSVESIGDIAYAMKKQKECAKAPCHSAHNRNSAWHYPVDIDCSVDHYGHLVAVCCVLVCGNSLCRMGIKLLFQTGSIYLSAVPRGI